MSTQDSIILKAHLNKRDGRVTAEYSIIPITTLNTADPRGGRDIQTVSINAEIEKLNEEFASASANETRRRIILERIRFFETRRNTIRHAFELNGVSDIKFLE